MHPIIYDVAVSADGFIAGPDADVSAFPPSGPIVDDYTDRLSGYAVALMGRATYEFGYRYGLPTGANPYPHMRAIVVSGAIQLPSDAQVEVWRDLSGLEALRESGPGPIYLCGGGQLAGAIASAGHLSQLRLKRAPVILGGGTPLFSGLTTPPALTATGQVDYGDNLLFQTFRIT
ncbi:dihydrofolate reductase family protein [Hasllibacter sp. MH4015]|uniref:dihydrofolate reductase family protein n=1 Tax=Hasllibacter sp. MH4015 TaxID=2854029 RepID=UPI001CD383A7|nr:dihydrofolate reductase family protein [Hasllibacter sp. MH4015]